MDILKVKDEETLSLGQDFPSMKFAVEGRLGFFVLHVRFELFMRKNSVLYIF